MQLLYKELKDLSVSLLFEDPIQAQTVTAELRKMGIFAHYFSNIHDFWTSCLHQSVDVLIVDNNQLENSGVSLKDHPRIRNKQIAVIINSEEPALLRTDLLDEIRCLGFIDINWAASEQLQVLMNAGLDFVSFKLEHAKLTEHRERLRARNQELVEGFEKSKQFSDEYFFTQQVVEMLDSQLEIGFNHAIDLLFEKLNFVRRYAILEVNASGTQIVSTHKKNRKTANFVNLWEKSNLEDGIKPLICERLIQYGHDLLGGNIVPLKICGEKEFPEIVVLLSVEDKGSSLFPWKLLEEQLSYRYLRLERKIETVAKQIERWSAWELFSYLDEVHHHHARSPKSLLTIDFSEIIELVSLDSEQVFFWESFRTDFEKQIVMLLGVDIILIDYGVSKLTVLVEQSKASESFVMLEDLNDFFEFWRYFENTSLVLSKKIIPTVSIGTSSSVNFLKKTLKATNTEQVNVYQKQIPRSFEDFRFEGDGGNAH